MNFGRMLLIYWRNGFPIPLRKKWMFLPKILLHRMKLIMCLAVAADLHRVVFGFMTFIKRIIPWKKQLIFWKRNMEPVVPTLRWRVRITVIRIMTQKVSVWEKGTSSHRMRKCFYPGMWLQSGLKNWYNKDGIYRIKRRQNMQPTKKNRKKRHWNRQKRN